MREGSVVESQLPLSRAPDSALAPMLGEEALAPFKAIEWRRLSPAERLERAWALRERLVDPQGAHDSKLFPAP